ncbi:MAG: hypothetical protein MJD61_06285 [Proteobacteria bacterium]|nr:hypothetical protein [Pseudomonadota bacterium]
MTQPRYIVPGMTVMVTRRTLRRTHLFRPDPELTELYRYCLAGARVAWPALASGRPDPGWRPLTTLADPTRVGVRRRAPALSPPGVA